MPAAPRQSKRIERLKRIGRPKRGPEVSESSLRERTCDGQSSVFRILRIERSQQRTADGLHRSGNRLLPAHAHL